MANYRQDMPVMLYFPDFKTFKLRIAYGETQIMGDVMRRYWLISLCAIFALSACENKSENTSPPQGGSTLNSSLYVATSVIAPGAECANGGISVKSGLDTNNNGTLDNSEITETQIVCNGIDGNNGLNSLVSVSDEPAGANCGAGGKKIEVGLDSNSNNTLDSTEVTSTSYVCHGIAGSGGTNSNCQIIVGPDNSQVLQCLDSSVVLVPGNVIAPNTQVNAISGGFEVIDSWQSSGGRNKDSFRNPHYLFDLAQDGDVSFNITSNSQNYIYLLDNLGTIVAEINNTTLTQTLTAGTYTVVAATYNGNVSENYTLQILGGVSNIRKIDSQYLTRSNTWTLSAGRNTSSYRNHHYTFDVTQDTYIDIMLTTSVGTALYLLDSHDVTVGTSESTGGLAQIHTALKPDTYRLVAGTYTAGATMIDYTVEMYGQFSNFTQISSNHTVLQGSWISSGGRNTKSFRNDHYLVEVLQDTYLDIDLITSVGTAMYLVNDQGVTVGAYESTGGAAQIGVNATPGIYEIVVGTYTPGSNANYNLDLFGHFNSVNKIVPTAVLPISGSWTNSAGRNALSYRNPHYSFTAATNTYIDVLVESSVGLAVYLVDSSGIIRLSYESTGGAATLSGEIAAGDYTIVVGTYNPLQSANFNLSVHGQYTNLLPVSSQTLTDTGAWAVTDTAHPFYSFSVNSKSYVDVMMDTPVDTTLTLTNNLGTIVYSARVKSFGMELEAGTYTLELANTVGVGNYQLSVIGQVANLLKQ